MKTILITGSTDGLGKLSAIKMANDGHRVILHGRNKEKLDKVIEEIRFSTENDNIEGVVADFSDLSAVDAMVSKINSTYNQIDVVVNNAGIFKTENTITKDGLDIRFVVNYLAPVVLTNGILPLVKRSVDARIINLSSAAQAPVDEDAFFGNEELEDNSAYAQSKLAILMWSVHLAQTHRDVLTIALNPGSLLNTKMVQEAYGRHWSPADKGANIIYDLALSEEYNLDNSGSYFDNDKGDPKGVFGPAHPDAYDDSVIDELIEWTNKILK